jgi:phosphoserine phosphatase RsbU/P
MFKQYHYLYVEDDPLSREVMQVIMEKRMGITTLTIFEDSSDFMRRLKGLSHRPDVFLLDIQMMPCDGFELLRMIRADPTYDDSIIIALTASVMNEEVAQLKKSGFDGAIAKPLDLNAFPALLERVLNHEKIWHIT